jgi:hypothetical protein
MNGCLLKIPASGPRHAFASLCFRHSTATGDVRIALGKAPAARSTSTYLPLGWESYIRIALGDQLSALGNDSTTDSLNVTEMPT